MDEQPSLKRLRFLRILCGLSLVNAIYGALTGLTNAISPASVDMDQLDALLEEFGNLPVEWGDFKASMEVYTRNLLLNIGNLGASNFLFYGVEIVGVIMMMRLSKIGLVLYAVAQIGLALAPGIFGGFNSFGTASLVISLVWNFIWVGMYFSQKKHFYE